MHQGKIKNQRIKKTKTQKKKKNNKTTATANKQKSKHQRILAFHPIIITAMTQKHFQFTKRAKRDFRSPIRKKKWEK